MKHAEPSHQSVFDIIKDSPERNVCVFWPEPWLDDLRAAGIRVFNTDYNLYSRLNYKLAQFELLEKSGSDLLRRCLAQRRDLLGTRYLMLNPTSFEHLQRELGVFVLTDRVSFGGQGVFLVRTKRDFEAALNRIDNPVVRAERFVKSVSLTQLGIVFEQGEVLYPVQTQIIKEVGGRLRYMGASSCPEAHVPASAVERASEITKAVGRTLSGLGYRGAYGCDHLYLPAEDLVLLQELNPRFIAETHLVSKWTATSGCVESLSSSPVVLDPHFLHVWAHLFSEVPSVLTPLLDNYSRLPLKLRDDTLSSVITLGFRRGTDLIKQHPLDMGGIIYLMFKGDVIDDASVPVTLATSFESISKLVGSIVG